MSNDTASPPPAGQTAREWISFEAEDGHTWMFDLTFFRSNYHCIYGQGCSGIESVPDPDSHRGCCSYGAHFVDEDDLHRVIDIVATLSPDQWENAALFPSLGSPNTTPAELIETLTTVDEDGDRITRIVDGACVLLNSGQSVTGPGCALHFAAVDDGVEPLEWKPEVCWQVPIRVEHHVDDHGHHTHFVRQWTRGDWGEDAGIAWWCADADEAYTASQSAAHTLRAEVAALAGPTVADALVQHVQGLGHVVSLPLPRKRTPEN